MKNSRQYNRDYYLQRKQDPDWVEKRRLNKIEYRKTLKFKHDVYKRDLMQKNFLKFLTRVKKLKRWEKGIEILIDGERVKTPILPPKRINEEGDSIPFQVSIFKKVYKKFIKTKVFFTAYPH